MKGYSPLVAELRRTVEIGWYGGIGDAAPIYLVVKVYRDLAAKKRFFPTVARRDFYRLKPNAEGKAATQIVEVEDTNFDPNEFTRTTEAAATKAIVDRIRSMFEPAYRKRAVKSARRKRR